MQDAAHHLSTAIAELQCISTDDPVTLSELRALTIARGEIDLLLQRGVSSLRSTSTVSWPELGEALELRPGTARKRYA